MENVDKKVPDFFGCGVCDYITSRSSQYARHILTRKHKNNEKMLTNVDTLSQKDLNNETTVRYKCVCGKYFSYRQSLSVHRKKCNILNINIYLFISGIILHRMFCVRTAIDKILFP